MRVADDQLFELMTGNLGRLRRQSLMTQTQIATGKRVVHPSDDPIGFGQVISLKATLSALEQRLRNIQFGQTRLAAADSALGQAGNILARIKELTVAAGSTTYSPSDRGAVAQEVRQLQQQLVMLANTRVNGQAIFAGTKTDQDPFLLSSDDTVSYQGNDDVHSIQIGEGQTVQTTVPGSQVFTDPAGGVFQTLKDLLVGLETNDSNGIRAALAGLDAGLMQTTGARGRVGALENRLQNAAGSLEEFKQHATVILSGVEDSDLTATLAEFSRQQVAFQAAAQTTAQILDMTLLNFLR
jgi:flagellar hook-associated protein 3 FlgL